jgi:hypothetical protein
MMGQVGPEDLGGEDRAAFPGVILSVPDVPSVPTDVQMLTGLLSLHINAVPAVPPVPADLGRHTLPLQVIHDRHQVWLGLQRRPWGDQ